MSKLPDAYEFSGYCNSEGEPLTMVELALLILKEAQIYIRGAHIRDDNVVKYFGHLQSNRITEPLSWSSVTFPPDTNAFIINRLEDGGKIIRQVDRDTEYDHNESDCELD